MADVVNTMAGKDYEASIDKAMERILAKVGERIRGEAILRAPVDYGQLAGSISWATHRSGDGGKISKPRQKWTLYVGTNVEYAAYVEYGTGLFAEGGEGRKTPWVYYNEKLGRFVRTHGNPPQPYLRPAARNAERDIIPIAKREIEQALRG